MTLDVQEVVAVDASPFVFLDAMQDAVYLIDRNKRIVFWNEGAERMYGWARDSVIGQDASHLLYEAGNDEYRHTLAYVREHSAWFGEHRQMTLLGEEIVVESRWSAISEGHLHAGDILIVNSDITARKQQQLQQLRTQRLESLGTLASGIAHDMNNILGPILISIQMLGMRLDDDKSRQILTTLEASTRRGAELLKQVLSFARGLDGQHVTVSLSGLMEEIHPLLARTFPRSITLHTHLDDDLWAIRGDATQLHQVIMNLCVNARDALPEGGHIWIKARNAVLDSANMPPVPDARPGQFIVLAVADNGVGMTRETLAMVFEPFYSTKKSGIGLGLSTLLGIIRSHQGFVHVESQQDYGTTFKVYLPAVQVVSAPEGFPASYTSLQGHGEWILLVDDEEAYRLTIEAILSEQGYRVLTARNGEEGLAVFGKHHSEIGLVITDLMMPVMDGEDLIKAVRMQSESVPIVAISGGQCEEDMETSTRAKITAFLAKPFDVTHLNKVVSQVLS